MREHRVAGDKRGVVGFVNCEPDEIAAGGRSAERRVDGDPRTSGPAHRPAMAHQPVAVDAQARSRHASGFRCRVASAAYASANVVQSPAVAASASRGEAVGAPRSGVTRARTSSTSARIVGAAVGAARRRRAARPADREPSSSAMPDADVDAAWPGTGGSARSPSSRERVVRATRAGDRHRGRGDQIDRRVRGARLRVARADRDHAVAVDDARRHAVAV